MSLNIRKSLSHAAIFRCKNKRELSLLMSEIVSFSNDEIDALAKHVWKEPYSFMFLDTYTGKVYNKFNELEIED